MNIPVEFQILMEEAREVMANHMDVGAVYVDEDNHDDDYPVDEDGYRWYQDWWNLREALRACENLTREIK
jgi:hypothetical protein